MSDELEEENQEKDPGNAGAGGDPVAEDRAAEGVKHEPVIIETTAVTKPKADELKVVIIMKDSRFMVGVQAPDCDPVSEVMEGTMEAVLASVPGIIEAARAKWATHKRNPKADMPAPPPPPPRPASSTTSSRSSTATKTKPAAPPAQPNFF